ncbi:MAG: 3-oxoacyl-[acyl-carrier-protein] reductase [Candidatus Marinimicrobia bacterium]|nr:3-oxoacyl-[acyl-carrier-protein] reductase [Candidatus Neomarinimicrobiota bacterium]
MFSLSNKIAIVTGASRGIGSAIAHNLSKAGAKVVLISRSIDALESVESEIKSNGGDAMSIAADVSNLESFSDAVSQVVEAWGTVDILINNAGITRDNIIMRLKEEDWDAVIDINLKGCFNGIKSVTRPMMKARCGRIINITSVIGLMGNSGQSNYAASKAGILGLTKSIAKELGSRNITVNAIAPGYIQTEMTDNLDETSKDNLMKSIPLQRLGQPQEIANLVCFLASDEAAYITGQTLNVDGGMVMY